MSLERVYDDSEWNISGDSPSKTSRVRQLARNTKEKTKRLLEIDQNQDEDISLAETARRDLESNPAFNPSKLIQEPRTTAFGIVEKTFNVIQGTAKAIVHPQKTIQSSITKTAAGKLAKGRPKISKQADLDFLYAYDDLKAAESSACTTDEEATAKKKGEIRNCNDLVADLEEKRMAMRVAWITDRHMSRVKVIKGRPGRFPEDKFFKQSDDCGEKEFRWGKWLAYTLLYYSHDFTARYIDDFDGLSFDIDSLRKHVERFIIVSAPIQTFCYRVRRIYRWEDGLVATGKWMALYFTLLYFSQIMTFAYAYTFFVVIKNYYYPTSLEDLQSSMKRAIDRGAIAMKVVELMDRHGNDDWLEPLVDQIGPLIQLQLHDIINLLEVLENFYQWRTPRQTGATLFLIFVCGLISGVASTNFCLKIIYFISGITFFICWPIASYFPNYRLLVTPFKWMLWDIPTHAEWSISYLQYHSNSAKTALETREYTGVATFADVINHSSDYSSDSDTSFSSAQTTIPAPNDLVVLLSFRCTHLHTPGRLIISTNGLHFRPSIRNPVAANPSSAAFSYRWAQLAEMNKPRHNKTVASSITKTTTGLQKLELRILEAEEGESGREGQYMGFDGAAGTEEETLLGKGEPQRSRVVVLESMRKRDSAFNAILGFSGLRWQSLQSG